MEKSVIQYQMDSGWLGFGSNFFVSPPQSCASAENNMEVKQNDLKRTKTGYYQ